MSNLADEAGSDRGGRLAEIETALLIHDLKSPLAVVEAALVSLLERQEKIGPLNERQERTLRRALRGVRRGAGLIDGLLEIARADQGQERLESVEVEPLLLACLAREADAFDADLAEAAVRLARQEAPGDAAETLAPHGVSWPGAGERIVVEIDRRRLEAVAGNVLRNALAARRQRLTVAWRADDERLVIDISDDGPGVAAEDRERIFAAFERGSGATSRGGHGLGLAACRVLARAMGGDLELSSAAGGASFRLSVPTRAHKARQE